MKKILFVLPFLLILQADISAQASAVMTVSVRVISGVNAGSLSDLYITDNLDNSQHGEVTFTTSPNSDIEVETTNSCTLINNSGHSVQIKTDPLFNFNPVSGAHSLSINGELPLNKKLAGNYTGNLVTTIVYL